MAKKKVKKMRLFIDPIGNTMHFWWEDPKQAHYAEEAGEGLDIVVFNSKHSPIGFEKLGVFPQEVDPLTKRLIPTSTRLLVAQ